MAGVFTVWVLFLFVSLPSVRSNCFTVALGCLADPVCRSAAQPLIADCSDILRTPPGSPPSCTEYCSNLVSKIFNTPYGLDFLHCDCSTVQFFPGLGSLCKPLQSNAKAKCTDNKGAASPTPTDSNEQPTAYVHTSTYV